MTSRSVNFLPKKVGPTFLSISGLSLRKADQPIIKAYLFVLFLGLSSASARAAECVPSVLRQLIQGPVTTDTRWNNDDWPLDGKYGPERQKLSYNRFFSSVLHEHTFEDLFAQRNLEGRSVNVADFFGSAVFASDLTHVTSLTGVRLKALPNERLPTGYPNPKWDEVTGSLFTRKLWSDLSSDMKKRKIDSFDFMIIRPQAPLQEWSNTWITYGTDKQSKDFLSASLAVINRSWNLLSGNGGELYAQITPLMRQNPLFLKWVETIRASGVECELNGTEFLDFDGPFSVMRLRKSGRSPAVLPNP
jgi:hypothetical protein